MLHLFCRLSLAILLISGFANAETPNSGAIERPKAEVNKTDSKEPVESLSYTLQYASGEVVLPLLRKEILSGVEPALDLRTNTITYQEFKSNVDKIRKFLEEQDKPVKQVMIEARFVLIKTESLQKYGIDWKRSDSNEGSPSKITVAILTTPQLSTTLRKLNEDGDVEFLANPRMVTGDGQKATVTPTKRPAVPQLNFNERNPRAVFGGFANALSVTPTMSSIDEVTLQIQLIPGRKQAGQTDSLPVPLPPEFRYVLKSGDTLALTGLFDEPDQLHTILIFITPTLLKPPHKPVAPR